MIIFYTENVHLGTNTRTVNQEEMRIHPRRDSPPHKVKCASHARCMTEMDKAHGRRAKRDIDA